MNYKQEDFTYKADTSNPAVLGVLEGPVADIVNPTRNGRKYSDELWQKVFDSEIVNELLESGGIFGESQHPTDRQEVDTEKIAIALKEKPVKHDDGKLYARFYILDTPCGRILKTLADFGYKIGISSRGSGDTYTDSNGDEVVDPDTYDFVCFDAVLLPAVKDARMHVVKENLQNVSLKTALNESLSKATPDERKVMETCLKDLDISYEQQSAVDNIDEGTDTVAVEDSEAVVKELQEALKKVKTLESTILTLQEKLSVSYTKEAKNEEQISRYKKAIVKLNGEAANVPILNELYEKTKTQLDSKNDLIQSLKEQLSESKRNSANVRRQVVSLTEDVKNTKRNVAQLTEERNRLTAQFSAKEKTLQENVSNLTKDLDICRKQYAKKLENANNLVEKYKKIAQTAVDKYIKSQAVRLGVSTSDITSRLSESYTFTDIDKVCEDLQSYSLSMSRLPFNSKLQEGLVMKVRNAEKPTVVDNSYSEDDVDSQLLSIAKLK